ncbi:hypothetical protein Q5P01_016774 [Channa striata]|uniref:Uncharacterized protein n=1 Tax=Channa striata TaxID=64152 RepID=A0AA88M8P9_CHASR|nr:hypothetical protein Q5P01_016774 [Channa striata]
MPEPSSAFAPSRCRNVHRVAAHSQKKVEFLPSPAPPARPRPDTVAERSASESKLTMWQRRCRNSREASEARTSEDARCPAAAAGEAERRAGELLITGAVHSLSCSASNQGGSWGFRGIKYGLRANRGRRGLVALTGKPGADGEGGRERGGRQRRWQVMIKSNIFRSARRAR